MTQFDKNHFEPRFETEALPFHSIFKTADDIGSAIYCDNKLYPDSKVWVRMYRVPRVSKETLEKFKVVGHEHEVDEVHVVAGKSGAAKFKWIFRDPDKGEETFFTESPCTVYIPAGTWHHVEWLEVNEPVTVVAMILKGAYP